MVQHKHDLGAETIYADSPQTLSSVCERLAQSSWVAVDTEFIRDRSYYPRLCLVQVGVPGLVACVDTLALEDLEPLLEVLYCERRVKVFHAASQDLEIFYHLRGTVPTPVFDTQVAATLLGHGEQVGYATLVRELLGIELSKAHTRADWSRRPLENDQLRYAADDVRYLRDIYQEQVRALRAQDRLAWLQSDFDSLVDVGRYRVDPETAWTKVKGAQQLRGVALATLRRVAAWREAQAAEVDLPKRWVMSDEALLDLARRRPTDASELSTVRGLKPLHAERYGSRIVAAVAQSLAEPAEQWPIAGTRASLGPRDEALLDALMAIVRLRAVEHQVSTSSLVSRKGLERVLSGESDVPLLKGWRSEIAGNDVQAFLGGKLALRSQGGGLIIDENVVSGDAI